MVSWAESGSYLVLQAVLNKCLSLEPVWFPRRTGIPPNRRCSPSPCQFRRWHQLARCIKADGREHNVGATPRSSGKTAVAPRLIETSPRPISTDGCHMYANKEQSESRSPISTTCLPHTAPPESPFSIHTHTHTAYPPNPFGGTSLFSPINSCIYIKKKKKSRDINMTLIIILFLFQEQTRGGGTGRQGWWTGTSGMARKRADRLFFVFVRDVSRVCSPRWRVKCGFCGQGASRPRELARCPFPLCVCFQRECMRLYLPIGCFGKCETSGGVPQSPPWL